MNGYSCKGCNKQKLGSRDQWWHFSHYGINDVCGTYCGKCSDKIYKENGK